MRKRRPETRSRGSTSSPSCPGRSTTELDTCVDRLQQLQVYLVDFESYDLEQLMSFARETNDGCNDAQADNAALAAALGAR